jgi:hypothetical protein
MKKIYLLASALFVAVLGFSQPFNSTWIKLFNGLDFVWATSTSNNQTTMAYHPQENVLLVPNRNDRIFIINPATGAEIGQLNTTGVGGEILKYNKIRVAEDGAIYAISLAIGAGTCRIYRWSSLGSEPVLITFDVTERCGDAFAVSGGGANTIIYAAGAANPNAGAAGKHNIYMLNTANGTTFSLESVIEVTTQAVGLSQWANRAIDPVANSLTSDLWINGGGMPARRITVGAKTDGKRPGTLAFAIPDGVGDGQASVGYGGTRLLITESGRKLLVFGGGNNNNAGTRMRALDVTDEANVFTYGLDSLHKTDKPSSDAYLTNTNGTGDVSFKKEENGEYTVFWLSTNNGMQATKTGLEILPVTLGKFEALMDNKTAKLFWNTTAENNNKGFYIERSKDGQVFDKLGFVATLAVDGNSKLPLHYQFEDKSPLQGRSLYRLMQIDRDGKTTYSDVKWVQNDGNTSFQAVLRGNPIVNEIALSISTHENKKVSIAVSNASGAAVIQSDRNLTPGENKINLQASQLPKGVYFITIREITGKGQTATMRVIK